MSSGNAFKFDSNDLNNGAAPDGTATLGEEDASQREQKQCCGGTGVGCACRTENPPEVNAEVVRSVLAMTEEYTEEHILPQYRKSVKGLETHILLIFVDHDLFMAFPFAHKEFAPLMLHAVMAQLAAQKTTIKAFMLYTDGYELSPEKLTPKQEAELHDMDKFYAKYRTMQHHPAAVRMLKCIAYFPHSTLERSWEIKYGASTEAFALGESVDVWYKPDMDVAGFLNPFMKKQVDAPEQARNAISKSMWESLQKHVAREKKRRSGLNTDDSEGHEGDHGEAQ